MSPQFDLTVAQYERCKFEPVLNSSPTLLSEVVSRHQETLQVLLKFIFVASLSLNSSRRAQKLLSKAQLP